ncbi:GspE/PulE family protein [Sphingomicrobium arenosum]|uniref:GspE/PulE family protein n=1 Tax=Sphingomicrobium arenosum TaxID=2233861 RepID=UPI002240F38C|nr:GspE/PulE family protein [Sphingomicrobium arenosum]
MINELYLGRHGILALPSDNTVYGALSPSSIDPAPFDFAFAPANWRYEQRSADWIEAQWAARDHAERAAREEQSAALPTPAPTPEEEDAGLGPAGRYLVQRLRQARRAGSSDVHLEAGAAATVVRQRIDGRLLQVDRLDPAEARAVVNRVKILAGLDLAESRIPQDGRLRFTTTDGPVDVRVATTPGVHGESVVLRLLGQTMRSLALEEVGLPEAVRAGLEEVLAQPNGIVILTGPTGSGKTTTLYAALSRLNRPEVKILTVEDPVEIMLDGITQVAVKPEIGLTFASALRSFLRQDPDVMMVGEVRDRDTADIALRSAMTGHLVLTSLHTNSAAEAFARLRDIGIENYLAAATVRAVIAQRLARRLCDACKRARPVTAAEAERFGEAGVAAQSQIYDAVGCPSCDGSGYRGRVPLAELLRVGEAEQRAVDAGDDAALRASLAPHETLAGRGLAAVAAGETDVAELARLAD